jgi:hypothetical protein
MKKTLLALTAALGLITSAHAHIGWTLQDCIDHWGQYQEKINDHNGIPTYMFKEPSSGMMITTQFYGDHVESICYITNNDYLLKHWKELLTKNYSGGWKVYDDGRGRETLATWSTTDNSAYAIVQGFGNNNVRLQVSTTRYSEFLKSLATKHSEQPSNDTLTNISFSFENLSINDLLSNDIDPRFVA